MHWIGGQGFPLFAHLRTDRHGENGILYCKSNKNGLRSASIALTSQLGTVLRKPSEKVQ